VTEQPTLTDGVVTLRPWQDEDVDAAVAGHDEEVVLWFGWEPEQVTSTSQRQAIADARADFEQDRRRASFAVEAEGHLVGSVEVARETGGAEGTGVLRWTLYQGHRGRGLAARAVRVLVDWALTGSDQGGLGLQRVEARIDPRNERSTRVATRSGLRREGEQRLVPGMGDRADATAHVVYARLVTDPPLNDPESFRALLNSFLPRKRAIGQLLVRDRDGRVLMCRLTYKRDWDLPGGVVEVGESPRLAVSREVEEELGLHIDAGALVLTDWLPPWSGWDDAICLVFDGGVHDPAILDHVVRQEREIREARFLDLDEVRELAADFTARRVGAALDAESRYSESGRAD